MMSPDLLAMIGQVMQAAVQTEMARVRVVETTRLVETARAEAEQGRMDTEAWIAREIEAK